MSKKSRLYSVVVITPDFDINIFRQPRFEPGYDLFVMNGALFYEKVYLRYMSKLMRFLPKC